MPNKPPIRTSVKVEERIKLPLVWTIVLSLVGAGIVLHIVLWSVAGSGLIWPFVFAVCLLLLVNHAADENAVGIPPFQAYTLFFGALIGMFLFVFLVSQAINPWLIVVLALGCAAYVAHDWKKRKAKEIERNRRRLAGLCVRCSEKVENGIEDVCPNCGLPVNQERLDLFRLGKAISMRSQSARGNTRQILSGSKQSRSQAHMQSLLNRPAKYKRGK